MKKTYMIPALRVKRIQTERMMALSKFDTPANKDGEVLTKEKNDWNIWE